MFTNYTLGRLSAALHDLRHCLAHYPRDDAAPAWARALANIEEEMTRRNS